MTSKYNEEDGDIEALPFGYYEDDDDFDTFTDGEGDCGCDEGGYDRFHLLFMNNLP